MSLRWQIFLITLIFPCLCALAQRTEKVKAEYVYYAPENVSIEMAKRTALERARIQAIADAFGTIVSQSNSTFVSTVNGQSSTEFFSLGSSDVKGEWIETIGEPHFDISYEQGTLVVKASITGKIREIVSAEIDFMAKILRNGTDDRFESTDFRNGDDLYLLFLSPLDGFLAVYLVDMEQQVYCLLPYRNQADGIYRVKANQQYIFFNVTTSTDIERMFVDEYVMTCSHPSEQNMVYVIFSPEPFAKAADNDMENLPRNLSFADFQKWLAKCRTQDKKMNLKRFLITINK